MENAVVLPLAVRTREEVHLFFKPMVLGPLQCVRRKEKRIAHHRAQKVQGRPGVGEMDVGEGLQLKGVRAGEKRINFSVGEGF